MTIADIQAQGIFKEIFKEYLHWSFQLLTDLNSNRFSASFFSCADHQNVFTILKGNSIKLWLYIKVAALYG